MGDAKWMVIDCCTDPTSGKVLPLDYLENIGVNVEMEVVRILCTHWDDDHIRGISTLLAKCKNASFCMPTVTDLQKFLHMLSIDYQKALKFGSLSSSKEMMNCLDIAARRNTAIIRAMQDRILFTHSTNSQKIEVVSLSPSDESVALFDYEISTLIDQFSHPSRKLIQSPNQKSLVLLLKLGKHRAILGADLEVTRSEKTGWQCIIESCQTLDGKASYFKIPHHGSENGYHVEVWNKLLGNQPVSTLTPWNRNKRLPVPEMIEKYRKHTSNLYITSNIVSTKAKKRDGDMEKVIQRFRKSMRESRFYRGLIRSRIRIDEDLWTTTLFDSAIQL